MLAYVWHKHTLSLQLEMSLPTLVMHWFKFCCVGPQVVPLTVTGVNWVGVKGALEAAVESLGVAVPLPEEVTLEAFDPVAGALV